MENTAVRGGFLTGTVDIQSPKSLEDVASILGAALSTVFTKETTGYYEEFPAWVAKGGGLNFALLGTPLPEFDVREVKSSGYQLLISTDSLKTGSLPRVDVSALFALLIQDATGITCTALEMLEVKEEVMHDKNQSDDLVDAAFAGDRLSVIVLLDEGADPNAMGRVWTPLHAAIENDESDMVELLLKHGADPNLQVSGISPLHHAIDTEIDAVLQRARSEIAPEDLPKPVLPELLLKAGADPNVVDDLGLNALEFARKRGHLLAVKLLENWGSSRE